MVVATLLFVVFAIPSSAQEATTSVTIQVVEPAPLDSVLNYMPLSATLTTAGQIGMAQIPLLASEGFDAVVSLASTNIDVNGLEGHHVVSEGMAFSHVPMEGAPDMLELQQFFNVMEAHAGKKVFVHCNSNRRASAFTFLYRVLVLGEDEATARAEMEKIWNPDDSESWKALFDLALKR